MSADQPEERRAKYWICDECAASKKMVPPIGCVTVIHGLCGWCKRQDDVMLTPVIDYDRPGGQPWD